jgi:uncharacterized CHY-type Zn-finger protein
MSPMTPIHGRDLDDQGRCAHYHTLRDIVAIKFSCCLRYYACYECHRDGESHAARRWSAADFDTTAILCGECRNELTIAQYLACGFVCPFCCSEFNPGCVNHYSLYFHLP